MKLSKSIFYIILTTLFFTNCSEEIEIEKGPDPSDYEFNFSNTKLSQLDSKDILFEFQYVIDDEKVLVEYFHSDTDDYISTFEYDQNGRVISEMRDGELKYTVSWSGNNASVKDETGTIISGFEYNNDLFLVRYEDKLGQINLFKYDTLGNLVSEEREEEVLIEYLYSIFDIKANPLNLIKSIRILRLDNLDFSKNMYSNEEGTNYNGTDYSDLNNYEVNYSWTLNSQGLIEFLRNDKDEIYMNKFRYN